MTVDYTFIRRWTSIVLCNISTSDSIMELHLSDGEINVDSVCILPNNIEFEIAFLSPLFSRRMNHEPSIPTQQSFHTSKVCDSNIKISMYLCSSTNLIILKAIHMNRFANDIITKPILSRLSCPHFLYIKENVKKIHETKFAIWHLLMNKLKLNQKVLLKLLSRRIFLWLVFFWLN